MSSQVLSISEDGDLVTSLGNPFRFCLTSKWGFLYSSLHPSPLAFHWSPLRIAWLYHLCSLPSDIYLYASVRFFSSLLFSSLNDPSSVFLHMSTVVVLDTAPQNCLTTAGQREEPPSSCWWSSCWWCSS